MNKKKQERFIADISSITGIANGKYVKKKDGGYIGAVKVPGIDIFHYKETDRDIAMQAFGNAVAAVDIPTKYIFIGCRPNFHDQIANIAKYELKQEDAFRRHILERERAWLEFYEKEREERLSFVLFFSDDRKIIDNAISKYKSCLARAKMTAEPCNEADLRQLFRSLLGGGFY